MPIAIWLMALAGLDLDIRRSALATALLVSIGVAMLVKQGALAYLWRSFDAPIDALVATVEETPAGAIIMQSECQPGARGFFDLYRQRQPWMTHLSALASIDDRRFVALSWAIPSQQPIQVLPTYQPYYRLQNAFEEFTCADGDITAELRQIQALVRSEASAGRTAPPIYLLLIRPASTGILRSDAQLIAGGPNFELYKLPPP